MTSNGQDGKIVAPPTPMKITQIAVVVRDMKSSLKSYTETLGWGPWSVFEYAPPLLHDTRVRGEAVEYRMIGAETSVDGLGFELIQPVSGPSIYQEWLDQRGEGLHHVAAIVESVDAVVAAAADEGIGVISSGEGFGADGSGKAAYMDTQSRLGVILELVEPPTSLGEPLRLL